MASTLKCPFCGGTLLSNEKNCPHCGGENIHYVADTSRRIFHPKTIEELKEYCAERGMPLLRMRFFIGQDYREPKAFGIYKAGENRYVVYKNKADGSRAVRYDGPDEAFAVNELFDKLLSECHNRGIYPDGNVQSSSGSPGGSASRSPSRSKRSKKIGGIIAGIYGFFMLMAILLYGTGTSRDQGITPQQRLENLRQAPDTYDSVRIEKRYYTYDLNSQTLVTSLFEEDHLNDGYYQDSYYVSSLYGGAYESTKHNFGKEDSAQEGAVYYRNGKKAWYVYIASESDWKTAKEPDYQRLGQSLEYLGNVWQNTWNVPDYSSFPVASGYYSHGEDCYYRDAYSSNGIWYTYRPADSDWFRSDCPVKLGIPADKLTYLKSENPAGIKSFKESSPYAVTNRLTGYYRREDQVYYRHYNAKGNQKLCWYTFGQKPDPDVCADPASAEWSETSEPSTDSLVYLGDTYQPGWREKWAFTDFKESAAGMQAHQINGYVKQEKELFYHYKSSWYRFDSDNDSWESSSEPSGDGLPEIYLGDTYQTSDEAKAADEWAEDWHTTDFKTSDAWKSIERAEAAESERAAWEAQEAAEKRAEQEHRNSWRDSYDSDYDSWDSDDTDWDSDW